MLEKLLPNVFQMKGQFIQATWETLYMTFGSAVISAFLGLFLGIFLVITQPGGILEDRVTYSLLDKVTNLLRSIPFIILLAVISPLTQYLIGTTVGTTASLVPLICGIFPFYARQVQNALLDVDDGVIEAAQAMGSSPAAIIFRIYLREGLADIVRVSIVTIISLIGLTTMAGAIGSGGLGDIAISIGYARFQNDVILVAMLIILILVFAVQIIGDWCVGLIEHRPLGRTTNPARTEKSGKGVKQSFWWLAGSLAVVSLIFVGIHTMTTQAAQADQTKTITIGSQGTDYETWKYIAKSQSAKDLGLKIKVKQITDGVQLNQATSQGNVDVNAFQSLSYVQAYNQQNKGNKLAVLGTTYLEPMGIYSKKYKNIVDLPTGATVAIANNPSQATRGLLLLQKAGLITLKKGFGNLGMVNDIVANPKKLQFKKIDDTTGPRVINNVDAVLISNTVALEGDLNVLKDSIFHEKVDQSTKANVNILVTAAKNKDNQEYKKIGQIVSSKRDSKVHSEKILWNQN
ncbi:hypothetical protein LPAF129_07470 [Ligilactobacillus pabuli]|uniref:ABC transmembrane type-1 domain-containing protein n=1 Tax=Ligilactobacillus pabuli TaxID=2886039 RepID=A0ABQ5JIG5_9LACO|nr:hypothetical protein LPAF129_07470 [Ligilactobacillus pabuli]